MIPLEIIIDREPIWPDLKHFEEADKIAVAMLDGGMASGKPSIAIRLDMDDGRVIIAQTSARLFCTAARAFMAKHPNLFED